MKRLSEKRLYELSQWSHRKLGVSCAICGKRIKKHDGAKYCCECAVSFGKAFDYNLILDGKVYTPHNPKHIMPVSKLESGKYIMVYRKHYVIAANWRVEYALNHGQKFKTYEIYKLEFKNGRQLVYLKKIMFKSDCDNCSYCPLKTYIKKPYTTKDYDIKGEFKW